jgi:hypothetical protein
LPAQGPWRSLVFSAAACTVALLRTATAQDAPPLTEKPDAPWSPAARAELPLPDADAAGQALPDGAAIPEDEAGLRADDESLAADDAAPLDGDEAAVVDSAAAQESAPAGVGNDDVLAMTGAQFAEATIIAVIAANPTRFDVSPRALVALKSAGVAENVIEAMLAAETAKKQAAAARPTPAVAATPQPSAEFTKLSAMIDRLAAQQETAEAARRPPDPPKSTDSSPRAWILNTADKTALAPTIAQVAFTDEKGGNRLKTLQGLAGKALAFANPAVSGIATTLGGLFRSDNARRTAVWALAGSSASRQIGAEAKLEIEFGHTPGVDPATYEPTIVQLVRTNDNYRLVAAAKTEGTKTLATASDPIVEELVPTELTRLARGHYRVQAKDTLGPGEYALVLRPIIQKGRRHRDPEASLGELMGGGTSQILYLTWDFSVAAP